MTSHLDYLTYRKLRAPQEHEGVHIEPPLDEAWSLLEHNRRALALFDGTIGGISLADLRAEAREHLLDAACKYTRAYLPEVVCDSPRTTERIVLAGHQPSLFHPGVWFKNFALDYVARSCDAPAINLIIDSDDFRSPLLRVPAGTPEAPHIEYIPFDIGTQKQPFEERRLHDRATAESFVERVLRAAGAVLDEPMLPQFWPTVLARLEATGYWGSAVAQARHRLEHEWGLRTLEVPQSTVCESPAFARFAVHLLSRLDRFVEIHNHVLGVYRDVHHLRNRAQPVPDLAADKDGRLEAPFWLWTRDDPTRRRMFVRRNRGCLAIGDETGDRFCLPLSEHDLQPAIDAWMSAAASGLRLRSRALITTMYARLILGDLFLHGIGGAKYDQVTDAIMHAFFGAPAPGYMILSATYRLSAGRRDIREDERSLRRLDEELRRMTWQPERYLAAALPSLSPEDAAAVAGLIDEKRSWITTEITPANYRKRFLAIRELNRRLAAFLAERRAKLEQERTALRRRIHAQTVLGNREYAFCLHSARELRAFFARHVPSTS
ncbi:hypothetical protein JCM19992_06360 [Thermostilla marina]